eukprot:351815-Chlamydomonas_euryale.AAC.7
MHACWSCTCATDLRAHGVVDPHRPMNPHRPNRMPCGRFPGCSCLTACSVAERTAGDRQRLASAATVRPAAQP